jgi:transcriptional regulator of acetoin/glycerol metabolism
MENTDLANALAEHKKQKEILLSAPGLLKSIKNSRDIHEMVDTISNAGVAVSCAMIDTLNSEMQLFVYWVLNQRAGKEEDMQSKLAMLIINRAEKLKLPVVQAFSMLCEEIPALKTKALVS